MARSSHRPSQPDDEKTSLDRLSHSELSISCMDDKVFISYDILHVVLAVVFVLSCVEGFE